MNSFKSMRMGIIAVSLIVSVITTCCLGGIFIYYILQENRGQIKTYREELETLVDARMFGETQIVLSMVQEIYRRQREGILTEEQARKEAADLVRSVRYDNGEGYFWIDTEDGVNVVLLGRETEGKSRIDLTDPTGKRIVEEILANGKQSGGGYTNFMFPKPGSKIPMPKRAYATYFAPWGWVIGTGIWTDHIDHMVEEREEFLARHLKDNLFGIGFILVLLQGVFVFMALYMGERMSKPVLAMTEQLRRMGSGDLRMDSTMTAELRQLMLREDELGVMGRAMQEMRDRLFEYQSTILGMARNDALTGLANRRYFQEYMEEHRDIESFLLIALDLDHFKEVNDTWGHQTGDAALLILAELLKASFPDGLNVRTGGDEFLVVLSGKVELAEVEERLKGFMNQLVGIYSTDPGLKNLTISGGVASSLEPGEPIDILIQRSDAALYQAKLAGRSCYRIYDASMEAMFQSKENAQREMR